MYPLKYCQCLAVWSLQFPRFFGAAQITAHIFSVLQPYIPCVCEAPCYAALYVISWFSEWESWSRRWLRDVPKIDLERARAISCLFACLQTASPPPHPAAPMSRTCMMACCTASGTRSRVPCHPSSVLPLLASSWPSLLSLRMLNCC